jgi:hypothetical protein
MGHTVANVSAGANPPCENKKTNMGIRMGCRGIKACSRWSSVSDTTGFVTHPKHPGRGASGPSPRRIATQKKFQATSIQQTTLLASLQDAQIGRSLPVVSLPLHRPATGWDASGILKQTAPPTSRSTDKPLHRQAAPPTSRSTDKPLHRQAAPPTSRSHYNPLHGPNDEMVFRAGIGRTDTAKRSPEQGVDVACSDHTKELVWRHLNVVERECELRCRLPRRRWQTPDPSHPLKTAETPILDCNLLI